MALIKCAECGKEISTTAESCPYCGYRTAHGRSVTKSKAMIVLWVVCAAVIVAGFVLILGNLSSFMDLMSKLKYLDSYAIKIGSFSAFLWWFDDDGVFWKVVWGIVLLIVGLIGMLGLKKGTDSIKGNGFVAEKKTAVSPVGVHDPDRIPTWQRVEMERAEAERKATEETQQ